MSAAQAGDGVMIAAPTFQLRASSLGLLPRMTGVRRRKSGRLFQLFHDFGFESGLIKKG